MTQTKKDFLSEKASKLLVKYEGELFFSVKHFAWLTKRSEQSVRQLIARGNAVRKLKSKKILGGARLIPASELTEFPFTSGGGGEVYHYDGEGHVAEDAS